MSPAITAFKSSPDRGRGLARDMRVRWAFEEVGQRYDVRLLSFDEMKQAGHLALHPFGQIPTYEDGDLALFESGAIVLHIAERHEGLLPEDADARARAISWMFAALSTVEPPIVERGMATILERDKPWYEARLPILDGRAAYQLLSRSRITAIERSTIGGSTVLRAANIQANARARASASAGSRPACRSAMCSTMAPDSNRTRSPSS